MVKEKRILSYFIGWLIIGFCILFVGVNNVFAEEITPTTGFRTQVGSFLSNNELKWSSTQIGEYNKTLYLNNSPEYYIFAYPGYLRLVTVTNLDSKYTYKLTYKMIIYELETSNWNVKDIDKNYNLLTYDDNGIIKDSKCSVISTNVINGTMGITVEKNISCTFSINNSASNVWINSGYKCKDCSLSGVQSFGDVTSDSFMYVLEPKLERFLDNSGVIIDQNQTIIDQNNKTNEELGNIKDNIQQSTEDLKESIEESNKETQDVIKDQFNSCRPSYNLINLPSSLTFTQYYAINDLILEPGTYTFSFKNRTSTSTKSSSLRLNFENSYQLISFNNSSITFTINEKVYSGGFYANGDYSGSAGITITLNEIMLNEGTTALSYEPYGEEICFNKLDETNDKLNDIQGSINDSNVDGSLNNAGSFFDNFTTTDHGGLSGIVTAPLVAINQMLNTSCSPMTATYKSKEMSLPCGYEFWNKMGPIQDFLNIILGGLLCYRILIKLYKLIDKIKNPEDDRLEVMDL